MKKRSGFTRRQFVARAAMFAAGTVLARTTFGQTADCPKDTLKKIGEIASTKGKLKAVLKVKNGPKRFAGYKGSQLPMMRYFEGYDQQASSPAVWPDDKTLCLPGPTLRVSVGERVEITLLNQVDVGAFPAGSIDSAETGTTDGCDQATNATVDPPKKNWYPGVRGDTFPNCLHASSTMNLHFHGAHDSPEGFGDNVLAHLRPDPKITEDKVKTMFDEIFAEWAKHDDAVPPWHKVPEAYRKWQEAAVKEDDLHAIWKGKRGPIDGKPALPLPNQLAPKNEDNIAAGLWPQYFVGAFPNTFKVTEAAGHVMGQAPGTHWYHAHKHGSTSINLLNGLAGALIIEGDYDRDLTKIYPDLKTKKEKVLVVQTFEPINDLMLATGFPGGKKLNTTNGVQVDTTQAPQVAPTIVMQPGEVQLWRIVNAQVQNNLGPNAKFTAVDGGPLPEWRQIAQDGVQFSPQNYKKQPLKVIKNNVPTFTVVAGGRIDMLVQAPKDVPQGTTYNYTLTGIVNLAVCGDPVADELPKEDNYPVAFPPFLGDIGECRIHRTLSFDWEQYRWGPGPAGFPFGTQPTHCLKIENEVCTKPAQLTDYPFDAKAGGTVIKVAKDRAPYFMIDQEQFSEKKYYQTMILGHEEEWTIKNYTNVPHPFHIHVNPFQVIEFNDPNPNAQTPSYKAEQNGVWQDTVNVPSALKDANGNVILDDNGFAKTPGFVRIRSRFVDFTGSYVLHCHILAHEDRGMMQLVRVIDGRTTIQHH